jgi:hypothetical protein
MSSKNQRPPEAIEDLQRMIDGAAGSRPQPASVGRSVHYVSRGSADGFFRPTCRAAVITEVADAALGIVGLCILNPTGLFFDQHVRYSALNEPGTWHWQERI